MRWSVTLLVKLFFHVFVDNLVETIRVKHQTSNLKLSFVVCHERENHGPITSERRAKYWSGHFYIIFRFFSRSCLLRKHNFLRCRSTKTHLQAAAIISNNKASLKQPELWRFLPIQKIHRTRVPDVGIYGFNKCFSFQQNNPVYKINWFQRARF